jgi:hypothetical protein
MLLRLGDYIEALAAQPAFKAYSEDLKSEFDYHVDRLLDMPPEAPSDAVQQQIGHLRGLRDAIRLPDKIARLARENTE